MFILAMKMKRAAADFYSDVGAFSMLISPLFETCTKKKMFDVPPVVNVNGVSSSLMPNASSWFS